MFVKWLLTENTIEERIHQLLQSKRSLFKNVVDDLSDSVLTKTISEDELYALFGISRKRRTLRS